MESTSNPNPKFIPNNPKSKNTCRIGGLQVEFPFQPYGTQFSFMNRVISTLDKSLTEGHCHALLESPTGTGKSLSLLCSALAWQQNQKLKNIRANLTHSSGKANPEAVTDPINYGGGFVLETQPSGNPATVPPVTANGKKEKQRMAPTIFYSTRTHAQITQVVWEYKKTTYRVPMSILGSRKHYCTNPYLRGEANVDDQCKLLLKNKEDACPEFKNVHKVKGHPSLQKGGCHEVHDIEDLVKIGQVVKGCSYFAARSMAQDAELVFCPYNYIINPVIRDAMEVDIKGGIIIFDEAHNIEDITRDAGSADLEDDALLHLQTELGQLTLMDAMTYQPLFEMTQDILSWIERRKDTLENREFQRYFRCWTGDKALKELQEANISLKSFPILQECTKKAIKAATEAESDIAHLSGMASNTLQGLFSSLSYFFSENGLHANDYELALQRYFKKVEGVWANTFSLWCLNPAIVFKDIAQLSQSVILTSGTLSPLNTFSSELGIQFGSCLEAPHVIDVNSQVWAGAIANGPGNYPLNASYKTADEYAFQDSVGKSLEEICTVVPGGCLVFFPSYKLLDKVSSRWQETGQWSRLNTRKSLFVEPRGSNQDAFEPVLKGYYNSIHHGTVQVSGRKRRGKKLGLKNGNVVESSKGAKTEGATFLAVCRGKVSEGMDFSDDNARAVVIVGIPFPNFYDTKVAQKKKFNDINGSSKKLLSGNEWYCQQAFRALNQAAGRCIRHRYDYGAIIFLDERFHKDRNRAYISKWLRNSIKLYSCFEESLDSLKSFFRDVKDRVGAAASPQEKPDTDCMIIESQDKKSASRKRDQSVLKSSSQQKVESRSVFTDRKASDLTYPSSFVEKYYSSTTHSRRELVIPTEGKDTSIRQECIDLDCDSPKDLRCCATPMVALPSDDLELTVVTEMPGPNFRSPVATSGIISKDDNYSSPRTNHPVAECFQQFHPIHKIRGSEITTPERGVTKVSNTEPDAESRSVNSNDCKRRKFLSSTGPLHAFNTTTVRIPDSYSSLASSITTSELNHKAEETNHSVKLDKSRHFVSPSRSDGSHEPSGLDIDERLKIFCLRCRNPLGLTENETYVQCSKLSSSKVHLTSLWKETSEIVGSSPSSVDILVCDVLSVNPKLCGAVPKASGQGIWCKQDGCVFNSIFCPFCIDPNNCLGVQVVATDASNNKFQNKILFYHDCLEIESNEAKKFEQMQAAAVSPHSDLSNLQNGNLSKPEKFARTPPALDNADSSTMLKSVNLSKPEKFAGTPPAQDNGDSSTMLKSINLSKIEKFAYTSPIQDNGDSSMLNNGSLSKIENFAYTSPAQDLKGWRNPKSRMRLPKKG